jgi:hypothetical protein
VRIPFRTLRVSWILQSLVRHPNQEVAVGMSNVRPLEPGDVDDRVDGELRKLAGEALRIIGDRIGRGEAAESAVVEVIGSILPGCRADTIVSAVLTALAEGHGLD